MKRGKRLVLTTPASIIWIKSRLSDDEKAIIEARKHNIFQAGKLYALRQAKTLGVEADEK
ncbi:hypothetical protein AGMMS50256_38070 [Betaproteobacteria bacterium]|nr:hypothetical protein AGMMS50256_38070 [Betaproteobacteria bacterium]